MTKKLYNFMTLHPCISTLIMSILVAYPCIIMTNVALAFTACRVFTIFNYYVRNLYYEVTLVPDWFSKVAIYSLISWSMYTIVNVIAAKNPYNKFGRLYGHNKTIIDFIIMYLPVFIFDITYQRFCVETHISMLIVLESEFFIGFIICKSIRRYQKKKFEQEISTWTN